jgi:hypothetical protein
MDMQAHIDQLISKLRQDRFPQPDDFHVDWYDGDRNDARVSDIDPVELYLPKIHSELDYATCLHELGHICGRYQKSRYVLTRERWAWAWARKAALQWTPEMERDAQDSLLHYANLPEGTGGGVASMATA